MQRTLVLVAALLLAAGLFSPGASAASSCDAPFTGCLARCGNCADALGVPNAHNCKPLTPGNKVCMQLCQVQRDQCAAVNDHPSKYEPGIDRKGGDYFNTTLGGDQTWQACAALCNGESKCKSWTFVKAGIQHPTNPRCWLKTRVSFGVPSGCCTSGVKGGR